MFKKYLLTTGFIFIFLTPSLASALSMPQNLSELAGMVDIGAQSYVVQDSKTGEILMSKNPNMARVPASLTKLVTALVVLDTKPKVSKVVTMKSSDQTGGACGNGGSCIKSKSGIKFTVDGLFHAALISSSNNAAIALARSTGLSESEFADRMNQKAKSLGAVNSFFKEPTGLDPENQTTASDYAKIVSAAFSNPYLSKIALLSKYTLRSTNNKSYTQIIKNTNKLIADPDISILGAKTGYLDESRYNFASLIKNHSGQQLAVVVLGEDHMASAFSETKLLAALVKQAEELALISGTPKVLGAVIP